MAVLHLASGAQALGGLWYADLLCTTSKAQGLDEAGRGSFGGETRMPKRPLMRAFCPAGWTFGGRKRLDELVCARRLVLTRLVPPETRFCNSPGVGWPKKETRSRSGGLVFRWSGARTDYHTTALRGPTSLANLRDIFWNQVSLPDEYTY